MRNHLEEVAVEGNLDESNAVPCKIDPKGAGLLMNLLSNMYGNSYKAVLREYSTNARDSHIEAGQTRPIEVTLPSPLQPSLLVRDYGVGLSKDSILNVYGTYLMSTKRESDDQVGYFGIGAKSALTMSRQFVVTGVKDGMKTVVLFSLNKNNVLMMNVLRESETDEPNGVLVSLAVPDPEQMQETAEAFFSVWDPGTVLVNGEQPKSVFDSGYSINDSVHIIPDREGVEVIMGAVGYPVSREILRTVYREMSNEENPAATIASSLSSWSSNAVYIKVGIGDVTLAPNRESLRDTSLTLNAVKRAVEAIHTDIVSGIEAQVNAATSWYDAMVVFAEAQQNTKGFNVNLDHIQWQNNPLTDAMVDLPYLHWYKRSRRAQKETLGTQHSEPLKVTLDRLDHIMVVTGVPVVEGTGTAEIRAIPATSAVSRVAQRVMRTEGVRYLLMSTETEGEFDWFRFGGDSTMVRTMTFDEFKAANKSLLAAEKKDRPKNLPSYDTVPGTACMEGRTPLSEILDEGLDLLVFDNYTTFSGTWMFEEATKDRTLIVLLPIQSLSVLEKHVNGEVEIIDGVTEVRRIAQEAVDALTDEQREVYAAGEWLDAYKDQGWVTVENYYGDRLDDILHDEFTDLIKEARAKREMYEAGKDELKKVIAAARSVGYNLGTEKVSIPSVSGKFPLLPTAFHYGEKQKKQIKHGIAYLNGLALS